MKQLWPRGRTHIAAVIGYPIEHSVSPQMQNAAFVDLGIDWCYVPFSVHPDNLPEAVQGMVALGIKGFNATIPHKQALLSLVDELTPAARAIGAVNTVAIRPEGLLGHNTDAEGFWAALLEAGYIPGKRRALVLGAGGASRAIVYALLSQGYQVRIANRTTARAEELAETMRSVNSQVSVEAIPLAPETLDSASKGVDLIVHCTSMGMHPKEGTTVWPEDLAFPTEAFLFDLVYNPTETRLMQQARSVGAQVSNGLGMLVHQGAAAFELWTGRRPNVKRMYEACCSAMEAAK